MTSSKITSDRLHKSLLGSNSLRGGPKTFGLGCLGGSDNWFEGRLDPTFQKHELERQRRQKLTSNNYYKPTPEFETSSRQSESLRRFNESGRTDIHTLRNASDLPPITPFVPPDPQYGHPPPGKWDTMYELTYGMNSRWREKPFAVDQAGSIFNYQKYDPTEHWRTTHMEHFRHRPALPTIGRETVGGAGTKPDPSGGCAEADPFRPCFLVDAHLRRCNDISTQTPYTDEFPPLTPANDDFIPHDEDGWEAQVPLQPTWLTGGTGRNQKPFHSSNLPPPSWPPPWRDGESAARLEAAVHRPGPVQDMIRATQTLAKTRRNVAVDTQQEDRQCDRGVHWGGETVLLKSAPPRHGYTGHRQQRGAFPKPPSGCTFLSLDTFT